MKLNPMELVICLIPAAGLVVIIIAIIVNRRERNAEISAGGTGMESEIRRQVRGALINAILGIVFFGIVLEPFALYRAGKAMRLIQEHNIGQELTAKARAAQIIAIVALCLWIILLCAIPFFRQQ